MDIFVLFIIICLAVYAINWATNLFYQDELDVDELELLLIEEEEAQKNETKL